MKPKSNKERPARAKPALNGTSSTPRIIISPKEPSRVESTPVAGMVTVQITAAEVVSRVLSGKNLDRELAASLAGTTTLTSNERAAVHSITFDTLRHYGLIGAQLDTLLSQPLTDVPVRCLLLVALAQLQFSKAASHAIVDHAVNAVVAMGHGRAKGLTNAVLRNFLREPDKFKRERFKDLVAKYDFPRWWIARLQAEHPAQWESIMMSARARPPMQLRINPRKTNAPDYLALLATTGIAANAMGEIAIELHTPVPVNLLPRFNEGLVSVQDIGAQLAPRLMNIKNGMRVLDACAAPGGKAGHLLETANVELLAIDSDKQRLKRVSENLNRLGLHAMVRHADAANLDLWWDKRGFDRILLDAPCSGSGVVRRHPDIKWIRRESDLERFAESQTRLLTALWNCLNVGGTLLYITCSVFRAENQDVIDRFLKSESGARRVPLSAQNRQIATVAIDEDGQLLPNEQHDGFYYALLEKHH